MMDSASHTPRPALDVAVVMRCEPVTGAMSRWQTSRWVLADVVPMRELPALGGQALSMPIPLEPDAPAGLAAASSCSGQVSHWLG